MMNRAFEVKIEEGLAVVTFDLPGEKVNILRPAVMREFEEVLDEIEKKAMDLKGVIIVSGKEGNFIAGADIDVIRELGGAEEGEELARQGQGLFNRLAALPVPTVAVIDGAALGGGLELALAADWRVASDSPRTFLGLPETQLGILPGFGGTQRLPRLIGLAESLRMITSGSRVYGKKALRIGLVDEVVPREHLLAAARRLLARPRPKGGRRRSRGMAAQVRRLLLEGNRYGRRFVLDKARKGVRKKTGGHYPAPLAAVDTVEEGLGKGVERGLAMEARLLGELAVTAESKGLIHVFRLKEKFSRVSSAPARAVARIGVVGAGVMGAGIASLAAQKGIAVRLFDLSVKSLGKALRFVSEDALKKNRRGAITDAELPWVTARVTWDNEMRGLGGLDIVIEAVAERMDVKKSVLADLSAGMGEDAVIASNTSSLSITEMAGAAKDPSRVAGMHFFNPVDKMPLVEIVRGEQTSEEAAQRVASLAKRLGKIPVVVKDRPGFLVNRLLLPYLNEGARLFAAGVSLDRIDRLLEKFGMPMGPFALLDMVGADIASHAFTNLRRGLGDRFQASSVLAAMVDAGRLGRKAGRGFYFYGEKGDRRRDPNIESFLSSHVKEAGSFSDEDIVDRLVLAMVNEASLCLEEGVVDGAEAVDAAMVLGAGFPAFTGGLLRYADNRGLKEIAGRLESLAPAGGPAYDPSALVRKLAASGGSFYGG